MADKEEHRSLQEDLSAAWDDVEAPAEGDEEDVVSTDASTDESLERDDSTELHSERGPDDSEPGTDDVRAVSDDTKEPVTDDLQGESESGVAPVSWNAKARETWKKIPKEAREYIQQREHQMSVGMQKNAEQARRAQAMDQTLAPYQQYFAMNGGPGRTIQELLQTGAIMSMGSPVQRAQTVANLIKQFGVDINALDSLLVGEPAPEGMVQNDAVQRQIQQAIQPYQQMVEQFKQQGQQRHQQVQQQAGSEVQQFSSDPKNEFYKDVSSDMADLLDMAATRNQPMSLKQAYDRACSMNPDISAIVSARQRAASLVKKRGAAVSISGTPGGSGGSSANGGNMRSDLEAAWDNMGSV